MQFDRLNVSIIKMLTDSRVPVKKIADTLGVTENTIRSRVRKLEEEGVLKIAGVIDPDAMKDHRVVMAGINIRHVNLVEKGEEISRLRGVISVSVVTGRYDMIVMILLNDEFNLLEFYTHELATVEDIQSVESFVVYKGFNLKVPYVL